MKKGIITMFAFASLFIVACGGGETEEVVVKEVVAENAIYYADVNASEVNWRGEVAGVYGHEGYVNLQSGMIEMAGDEIIGGEFAVDMSAFYPTDTASYKDVDGGRITDLQNHLTQEDFFASATYPVATFQVTEVNGKALTGELTVRGKTSTETFNITKLEKTMNGISMSGTLVFDRQKYDVAWVHFMKDMILSDDISIKVNLLASTKL